MGESVLKVDSKAKKLSKVETSVLLRAMSSQEWLRNPANLKRLKEINAAASEMDWLGDIGLTVCFEQIKILTTSEGIGEWFGDTGEFYIITSILDGSGKLYEHKVQYFQGIKRGDFLPLGDGGMLVGFIKNPRWFVDIHMLVMESDSDIRNLGKIIEEAKKKSGVDKLVALLKTMSVFDPSRITSIFDGINLFLTILAGALKKNNDDHVATIHDFYLKHQAFGEGRHPEEGLKQFQNVEVAYRIDLTKL